MWVGPGSGFGKSVAALPEWTPGGATAGGLPTEDRTSITMSRLGGTIETIQFCLSFFAAKETKKTNSSNLLSNYWGVSESALSSQEHWVWSCEVSYGMYGFLLPTDDLIWILFYVSRANDAVWKNFPAALWLKETPMVMWLPILLGLVECSV